MEGRGGEGGVYDQLSPFLGVFFERGKLFLGILRNPLWAIFLSSPKLGGGFRGKTTQYTNLPFTKPKNYIAQPYSETLVS